MSADDATKTSCESGAVDKDVNVSSGTYTRLMCGGIARFEYIEGAENYSENWPEISSAARVGRTVRPLRSNSVSPLARSSAQPPDR